MNLTPRAPRSGRGRNLNFDRSSIQPATLGHEQFRDALKAVKGQRLNRLMEDRNVPGLSIALVEGNQVVDTIAFGIQDVTTDIAVDTHTLFQAASVSKLVNAVAVLRASHLGMVGLGEDLRPRIPWTPPRSVGIPDEPLSFCQLLRHSSGFGGVGTTDVTISDGDEDGGRGFGGYHVSVDPLPTTLEVLNKTSNVNSPPATRSYCADTQISYSGGGTTVSQYALESITAQSYERWCSTKVFQPLEMVESTFHVGPPNKISYRGGAATGHSNGVPINGLRRSHPESAAAGLYTSVHDLARVVMLLNGGGTIEGQELLAESLVNEMMTEFQAGGGSAMLGCFRLGSAGYFHGGSNTGFRSLVCGYPEASAGLVVLTNGNDDDIGWDIHNAVSAALGWE